MQRLYFASTCQYFYLVLMLTSIALMICTIFYGLLVNDNPAFLFVEIVMNLLILADFIIRVWLQGPAKFFRRGQIMNYFDSFVVIGCVILFLLIMANKQMKLLFFEELSEELLLIIWSVFQTLRMIFIAKKQKLA